MGTSKLSREAAHAKYLYNKKYIDAYWEKKAKALRVEKSTTTESICINRKDYKDTEAYIIALENSNRTLASENRRIVNMLTKGQSNITSVI